MKALMVWGGWDGHDPKQVTELLANKLKDNGVEVDIKDSVEIFADLETLKTYDLITPCWTCGELSQEQAQGLISAIREGVGLGGIHGGMGDAFRGCLEYQWMVGGQFVAHPGGMVDYTVKVTRPDHPAMKGMPASFDYHSEQYYQLIDPGIEVLAESVMNYEGRDITLPTVWTKPWGKGRVFYSALGHCAPELEKYPHVVDMSIRGMLWAAEGKAQA